LFEAGCDYALEKEERGVIRITQGGEEKHEASWGKQRQRVAVGGLVALRLSLEGTNPNVLR
jgi:hypothetical protein